MKVRVFSSSACPWCVKVKDCLKENKIEFEEVKVDEDKEKAKEIVEKTGQMGVPVTEIDGEFVIGFDEEKLKKLLKI